MFKSIRKTVWKARKNAFEKVLAPLRPLKNISPALFNKFWKFFTAQNLHKKKFFFTARPRRGSHAKIWGGGGGGGLVKKHYGVVIHYPVVFFSTAGSSGSARFEIGHFDTRGLRGRL